ncbi:hypothetical protein M758_UG290700 [Ceratodon purpureus]|nr:hypothetical protein M758_UG290700 [Ceratodon purpureus]
MEARDEIYTEARRDARDKKLLAREEVLLRRHGRTHRPCPCNICLEGIRSDRSLATIRIHVAQYGRHPYHTGGTRDPDLDAVEREGEDDERAAHQDSPFADKAKTL